MNLRIHGRRKLKSPSGFAIRPTSSRIRQSVFDILQNRLEIGRWLDVCSGAGTMGAEALCHGVNYVVGIDSSRTACDLIRHNWEKVAQSGQHFQVIQGDAEAVLRRLVGTPPFDIVYVDPPYQSELYCTVLSLLPSFVAPEGLVLVEHQRGKRLPEQIETLRLAERRRYGKTEISFFQPWVSETPLV